MSGYVDARELSSDYDRHICPNCGIERWFKFRSKDRWPVDQWNCERCGKYLRDTLEYPCPECDVRMALDGSAFVCRNVTCDYGETPIDRDGLIDRLSDRDAFMVRGMPGVWAGDCPVCGADHGIDGGPDGELTCSECPKFYAGQYSDTWFCYAIWKREPDRIRVTEVYER